MWTFPSQPRSWNCEGTGCCLGHSRTSLLSRAPSVHPAGDSQQGGHRAGQGDLQTSWDAASQSKLGGGSAGAQEMVCLCLRELKGH